MSSFRYVQETLRAGQTAFFFLIKPLFFCILELSKKKASTVYKTNDLLFFREKNIVFYWRYGQDI